MESADHPPAPDAATAISYALLQSLGFILNDLSAQGLTLWQDADQRWHWAWHSTALRAEHGLWAMGEALVEAVVTRFPQTFSALEERQMV